MDLCQRLAELLSTELLASDSFMQATILMNRESGRVGYTKTGGALLVAWT